MSIRKGLAHRDVASWLQTTTPYPTPPLALEGHDIRVLDLLPGDFGDELQGILQTVSLEAQPSYQALSYTWGADGGNAYMLLNGSHRFLLRQNLYAALQRLRRRDRSRTLWVDAVCINQNDYRERFAQVQIMSTIYRQADTVLVWLGDVPQALETDLDVSLPHLGYSGNTRRLNQRGIQTANALGSAVESTEPSWHTRVWILQEFVLAHRTDLCFGPVQIKLDIVNLQAYCDYLMNRNAGVQQLYSRVLAMLGLQERICRDDRPDLVELLQVMAGFSSTDPKDRIYSILGIVHERDAAFLRTVFNPRAAKLSAVVTYLYIKHRRNYSILGLVIPDQSLAAGFPSFALRLSSSPSPIGRLPVRSETVLNYAPKRCSTHSIPGINLCLPWYLEDHVQLIEKRLHVSGHVIDRIATMIDMTCLSPTPSHGGDDALLRLARTLDELASSPGACSVEWQRHRAQAHFELPRYRVRANAYARLVGSQHHALSRVVATAFDVWEDLFVPPAARESRKQELRQQQLEPGNTQLMAILSSSEAPSLDVRDGLLSTTANARYIEPPLLKAIASFHAYGSSISSGASFMATPSGFVGIVPKSAALGDLIVVLQGAEWPVILRPCGDRVYEFRGLAYLHSFLDYYRGPFGYLATMNMQDIVLQ